MSDIKMSDVFDGDIVDINLFQDSCYLDTDEADYEIEDSDVKERVIYAINNHDRMTDEVAELLEVVREQRESLDAFRELVKSQTQTMNELNEKCKRLAGDNADLVKHLENLVDESIYLAQFKNETLRGNIRSTDLDEPEWHDYQTIGEAGAFLEKLKVSK